MIPNAAADLSTPEGQLTALWHSYRSRWQKRDVRHKLVDSVIRGDWTAVDDNDEALDNRSPNLVQVALEDTAEAAALVPSMRVTQSGPTEEAKEKARKMELMATAYQAVSEAELLEIHTLLDLGAHGMHAWVVYPDENGGLPKVLHRDARTCYPEPDFSTLGGCKSAFFAREVYFTQLPEKYKRSFEDHFQRHAHQPCKADTRLTLLEFFDDKRLITAGVYNVTPQMPFAVNEVGNTYNNSNAQIAHVSVIFENIENEIGVCPVVIGMRPHIDNEPHGQFDQVIKVLQAHIRLAALSLDYADQAVYSDIWVTDLIGEMSVGGGGYIQLGPQGKIGRVPPAVSGLSVYQELSQLIDNFHLGARWPKVRPGEVDQAIASAKFVEATAGVMNTVIRTYHQILTVSWERAVNICFKFDKKHGRKTMVAGIHKNQQFYLERNPEDIDLGAVVRAEFGLGLGRDPAQSMVLGIQANGAGLVSREFVQENFEGITDVAMERVRMDVQQLEDMMMAKLLQGIQEGGVPDMVLVDVIKNRQKGKSLVEVYEKFYAKPKQEAEAALLQGGLGGPPLAPGPEMGGGAVPPPPPPEALLGALGSGGNAPPETIGRLSTPLPGGGFMGSQSTGGGPPQ